MRHPRSPVLNLHFSTLLSLIDRPTWRSYFSTYPFLYNFNYSTYFCIRPKIRELYPDFNIGISTPIKEESDRWFQIYRHWSFKPKHHTRNLTRTKRAKKQSCVTYTCELRTFHVAVQSRQDIFLMQIYIFYIIQNKNKDFLKKVFMQQKNR